MCGTGHDAITKDLTLSILYLVTQEGLRMALFITKTHNRLLRPGLSFIIDSKQTEKNHKLGRIFKELDTAMSEFYEQAKMAA